MAITYTWAVTGMKVRDTVIDGVTYSNAVVQTYWSKTGTDENGNTGMFAGATPFSYDPTDADGPFIEYEDLTETDVLSWIQSQVTGSYEEHVNQQIQKQIDEKISPITEGMPWAPAAEEPETP